MNAFRVILTKDLRVELRTLQSVPAMALFALTTFVLFRFGLDRESLEGSLAAGVILATVLFAAILAINRLFVAEREEGGFDAHPPGAGRPGFAVRRQGGRAGRLPGGPRGARACRRSRFLFLDDWAGLVPLAGVLLLADMGLAAIGVLVSAIGVNSRARELIVPLLLLPLIVPVMIAAAGAAEPLLAAGGPEYDDVGQWVAMLALYDAVFLAIGYAVYDFLLED